MQLQMSQDSTLVINNQVKCVSYHIPMVGGSELLDCYLALFGSKGVWKAYQYTGAPELNSCNGLPLPASVNLVHGHFLAKQEQLKLFPNAKRVTWVCDPLDRVWRLFRHILTNQHPPKSFDLLKKKYIDSGINSDEELFYCFVKEPEFKNQVFAFNYYFKEASLSEFDFVGDIKHFEKEFKVLSALLTGYVQEPANDNFLELAPDTFEHIKLLLKPEYDIVEQYLRRY